MDHIAVNRLIITLSKLRQTSGISSLKTSSMLIKCVRPYEKETLWGVERKRVQKRTKLALKISLNLFQPIKSVWCLENILRIRMDELVQTIVVKYARQLERMSQPVRRFNYFSLFFPFGWISCRHFPLTFNGNHLISFTSDMKTLNMAKWMEKKRSKTKEEQRNNNFSRHYILYHERRTHISFLFLWFMATGYKQIMK